MYHPYYSPEHRTLYFAVREDPTWADRGLRVFFCGSLQDPAKLASLVDRQPPFAPAALHGYEQIVEPHDGARVPFMVPTAAPHDQVFTGIVYTDLEPRDLERIESLELAGGLRERVTIEVQVGDRRLEALTYLKAASALAGQPEPPPAATR